MNNISKWISKATPISFIDIGASGGLDNEWKGMEAYMNIIGFEPDVEEYNKLIMNKNSHTYFNIAVSDKKEQKELYIRQSQGNSSFYENNDSIINKFPHAERFKIIDKVLINTDTLDNILKSDDYIKMDFLKIDVEGGELNVLKGAESVLINGIFAIQAEVRFLEFYKNSPLFPEVHTFITSKGFELFDLNRYFYKKRPYFGSLKGQIGMADALYFMDIDKFSTNCKTNLSGNELIKKILKAIIISSFYGYFDYSADLLETNKNIFKTKEYESLMDDLRKSRLVSEKIPYFKGKGFIHRNLMRIANLFISSNKGAFHSDSILGNRKL